MIASDQAITVPVARSRRAAASWVFASARVQIELGLKKRDLRVSTSVFVATPAANRSASTRRASAAARTPASAASIDAVRGSKICGPLANLDVDRPSRSHAAALRRRGGSRRPLRFPRACGRRRTATSARRRRHPTMASTRPRCGKMRRIRTREVVAADRRQGAAGCPPMPLPTRSSAARCGTRRAFRSGRAGLERAAMAAQGRHDGDSVGVRAPARRRGGRRRASTSSNGASGSRPTSRRNSADVVSRMFSASISSICCRACCASSRQHIARRHQTRRPTDSARR